MKLLILYKLAKINEIYEITELYANKHNDVDSYFLLCDENISQDVEISDKIIKFKMLENNWDSLLIKVIRAFDIFKNKEYTNIMVTNVSTFVNIEKIIQLIDENIPVISHIGYYKFKNIEYEFPSGAGYIFNIETIHKICDFFQQGDYIRDGKLTNNFYQNYPTTDDIFLGYFLKINNINIQKLDRFDILNPNIQIQNFEFPHYRIKTCDYNTDLKFHKILSENIYF